MSTQPGVWFAVSLVLRGPCGPISSQALERGECTVLPLPHHDGPGCTQEVCGLLLGLWPGVRFGLKQEKLGEGPGFPFPKVINSCFSS